MGRLMATLAHEKGYPVGGQIGRCSQQLRETLPHLSALPSVRVGEHRLPLSGLYESIEIGHRAWDRRTFAGGARWAASWLPHPNAYVSPFP
jgi:dihydrodipicolinate reductase